MGYFHFYRTFLCRLTFLTLDSSGAQIKWGKSPAQYDNIKQVGFVQFYGIVVIICCCY